MTKHCLILQLCPFFIWPLKYVFSARINNTGTCCVEVYKGSRYRPQPGQFIHLGFEGMTNENKVCSMKYGFCDNL